MDELKKQMDDTLMSIAKAKTYLLGLEKTEKLRAALDLGKRRILYAQRPSIHSNMFSPQD